MANTGSSSLRNQLDVVINFDSFPFIASHCANYIIKWDILLFLQYRSSLFYYQLSILWGFLVRVCSNGDIFMFLQAAVCTYNHWRLWGENNSHHRMEAPKMKHEKLHFPQYFGAKKSFFSQFEWKITKMKALVWFLDNNCKVAGALVLWYCGIQTNKDLN